MNGQHGTTRRALHRGCWSTYYHLGVVTARELPAHCTWRELGQAFGVSQSRAYTEAMVALGKVVWTLRNKPERNQHK